MFQKKLLPVNLRRHQKVTGPSDELDDVRRAKKRKLLEGLLDSCKESGELQGELL